MTKIHSATPPRPRETPFRVSIIILCMYPGKQISGSVSQTDIYRKRVAWSAHIQIMYKRHGIKFSKINMYCNHKNDSRKEVGFSDGYFGVWAISNKFKGSTISLLLNNLRIRRSPKNFIQELYSIYMHLNAPIKWISLLVNRSCKSTFIPTYSLPFKSYRVRLDKVFMYGL